MTTPEFRTPRQTEIYLRGLRGLRPLVPVDPARLQDAAEQRLSSRAFAYLTGGAGGGSTMRANRDAIDRWRIVPRILRDVSVRDLGIELFGRRIPSPFILSPIGVCELMHPQADLAVARAAATLGVPMIFSSQASVPMEMCAAQMGASPRWFQLYWSRDDEFVESLVQRAEACGCEAIVVTVDTATLGWRALDLDLAHSPFMNGMGIAQYTSDPVFMRKLAEPMPGGAAIGGAIGTGLRHLASSASHGGTGRVWNDLTAENAAAAVRRFIGTFSRQTLTWAGLPFLRQRTRLPILLKGILHADDARHAVDAGMDGIIVSNHGGRQVDGSIGAMDALPAIVAAADGRIPVIMDSGIRSGADAFRALALGARAVGIGRPFVYGLTLAGEDGVVEVMENLIGEFESTLSLAGCCRIADISRDSVVRIA